MALHNEQNHGRQSEEAILTIKDLLAIPLLKDARLVAGDREQNRAITRVNVAESLDVFSWVRSGEFLIIAEFPSEEHTERLKQILPELVRRGVAVVGVMIHPYVENIAIDIVAEAERHGLPILEMDSDTNISDLVRMVMERALSKETSALAHLQNRIQTMTRQLLEGSGLYTFLDEMEEMLDNPVALIRENVKPWFSSSLRLVDSAEAEALKNLLTFRQIGRGANNGFMFLDHEHRIYVKKIQVRKMKQTFLVLIERNRDIMPIDALSLDRLSSLAGLELANLEAVREVEGKYLEQFMQDWLLGKIVSEVDWKLRAEVCGCTIPAGASMCAILVGFGTTTSHEKLRDKSMRLRSERIRSVDGLQSALVGEELALVLPIPHTASGVQSLEEAASQLMNRLIVELQTIFGDREIRLFKGRIVDSIDGLPQSWAQAKRARQVALVCKLSGEIIAYDRLGVYSLLYLIPSGEEREQFLTRFTIPLQQADRKGGGHLLETLEMFFQCNGNIKLTSERLYAHYNTIVYRLEKVQNILGVSLDNPEERLQLHLALKLGQITPGSSY